ncbi:MAG: YIP1 family protein [Anaerolineae bacterium]|nr:YIP1 family protein [Anaerolineae bacterium]
MTTTIHNKRDVKNSFSWRLLFGIIDQPVQTFQSVLAHRRWTRWGLPLLIIMVAFIAASVVQIPYVMELARTQAEQQLATLPPDQAEAARSTMAFTLSLPFMLTTTLGFGLLFTLFSLIAQSTFLYFGSFIFGGDDISFGAMFSINTWARLPMAIGLLVQAAFVMVSQGAIRYPGLAFLVASGDPLEDAANPLVPLLSSIDLFWLWSLLLTALGVSIAARISRGKAFVLTLIYAAVALGITVLPSVIFGAGLGG